MAGPSSATAARMGTASSCAGRVANGNGSDSPNRRRTRATAARSAAVGSSSDRRTTASSSSDGSWITAPRCQNRSSRDLGHALAGPKSRKRVSRGRWRCGRPACGARRGRPPPRSPRPGPSPRLRALGAAPPPPRRRSTRGRRRAVERRARARPSAGSPPPRPTASARVPRHTSSCSLVSSRATATRPVGAAGRGEVGEGAGQPVRRLVEDDRAPLGRQRGEPLGAARSLPGQEALEHEPAGGQPARDERGDHRRRARAPPRPCPRRRPPPAPAARPGRRCRACRRRSPPPPARRPGSRRSTSAMARTSVWSLTDQQRGAADAGVLEQPAGAPGVLAARRASAPASASTARGDRSPRLPIGVPTSTSAPGRGHQSAQRSTTRSLARHEPPAGERAGLGLDHRVRAAAAAR